jgi:hypothetical protein
MKAKILSAIKRRRSSQKDSPTFLSGFSDFEVMAFATRGIDRYQSPSVCVRPRI